MTKDYARSKRKSSKRRAPARSSARRSSSTKRGTKPGCLWLVTGLALGLFVAGIFYLQQQGGTEKLTQTVQNVIQKATGKSTSQKKSQVAKKKKTSDKPRFEFYSILRKGQEDNLAQTVEQSPIKRRPTTSQYLLQVASFKRYRDADTLKAKLLLLGYSVQVKSVKTTKGTWNRVYVGPYANYQLAKKNQAKLAKQKMSAIISQLKS